MAEQNTFYRPCAMCGETRYQVSDFWWNVECVACGHMIDREVVRQDDPVHTGTQDQS